MQTAAYIMARKAAPAGAPRLRVVRDESIDVLSFLRPQVAAELPFRELVETYRARERASGGRSPSALATLDDVLDGHLLPAFGGLQAHALDVRYPLALIDAHAHQGFAGSTTRKVLSTLSAIFEFSWSTGAQLANPVRLVPRSELPSPRPRDRLRAQLEVLSLDQVRAVLGDRSVLRFDERLLFGVLLLTGARFGEAAGLQWGDLARDVGPLAGQLRIARSWDCKRHTLASTKAGEPRLVPVMRQLAELLDEARAWFQRRWRRDPLPGEIVCRYLPPRQGGEWRLWSETTAIETWRRALVQLGIPHPATGPRRLHATRHTFVSLALKADAQERALEPVTHAPSSGDGRGSAFGLYGHFDWADTCRAVAKLQDALAGA